MEKSKNNLRILTNPADFVLLHTPTNNVKNVDDELPLIKEMIKILKSNNGYGLSAPQVGELKSIFIMPKSITQGGIEL